MNFNQVRSAVEWSWDSGLVPIIHGPPGVGKSDMIRQIASESEYKIPEDPELVGISDRLDSVLGSSFGSRRIKDVRLVLCNPIDLKGIPVYSQEEGRGIWVMTGMFPTSVQELERARSDLLDSHRTKTDQEKVISRYIEALHDQHSVVFLDELKQAPAIVQAAAFGFILDRTIATNSFADTIRIVAAGNRAIDRAGTQAMLTPMASRFVHLTLDEPDVAQWLGWASKKGVHPAIISYLNFRTSALYQFDPKKLSDTGQDADMTYPCPRTWWFANQLLSSPLCPWDDYDVLQPTLAGTIGRGAATEFIAHVKNFVKLPNPLDFLDGKIKRPDFKTKDGTKDLALEHGFILNLLATMMKNYTDDRAKIFIEYMVDDSTNVEFSYISLDDILTVNKFFKILKHPDFPKLAKRANFKKFATEMAR